MHQNLILNKHFFDCVGGAVYVEFKKGKNCMLIKSTWINYISDKVSALHYDLISEPWNPQ